MFYNFEKMSILKQRAICGGYRQVFSLRYSAAVIRCIARYQWLWISRGEWYGTVAKEAKLNLLSTQAKISRY
jgi:hypothetical protein